MNTTYLKHRICLFLVTFVGCWGLASCSLDEPVQEPVDTYKLRIQLNTNTVLTRADGENWGGNYDSLFGSDFENKISKVDIYMLGDGSQNPIRVKAVKDPFSSENVYILEITGSTPGVVYNEEKMEVTFNGRIMAIANVDDIDSSEYDPKNWSTTNLPYEMGFSTSENNWLIPMWGVEDYENVTLKANEISELEETILMLRAVSKIIINIDTTDTEVKNYYTLGEITMSTGSPQLYGEGYTLPKNALIELSTRSLSIENCFEPKTGDAIKKIVQPEFARTSQYECYTYVSESWTNSDNPFAFDVTLVSQYKGERPDITGTLYFANYKDFIKDTTITDVVRNHVYVFTIRLAELQLQPIVKEWIPGGKVHIDM